MSRLLVVDPGPEERDHLLRGFIEAGHRIVALSWDASNPSLGLCEDRLVLALSAWEQCAEEVRRLHGRHRLDGVVCYQQSAVHVANRLAHMLGLPPLWCKPHRNLADKCDIYAQWDQHGIAYPETVKLESPASVRDGRLPFPVVLKPSALMGGIGVRCCATAEEAEAWAERLFHLSSTLSPTERWIDALFVPYGQKQSILMQRLIVPDDLHGKRPEFTAECIVHDGRVSILGFFQKDHIAGPFFDEVAFVFPAPDLDKIAPAAAGAVVSAVEATGMQFGYCHVEFAVVQGQIAFFELNPRLIGEACPKVLTRTLGVDCAKLLADLALGRAPTFPSASAQRRYGGTVDIRAPHHLDGRRFVGVDEAFVPSNEYELHLSHRPGALLRASGLRGTQTVARVVFTCDTAEEAVATAVYWSDHARILSE